MLQHHQRPLALAQIDVDQFKLVNDTHGHAAGDAVLVALAQLLRENSRAADVLVRHGGEEFMIAFPDTPFAVAEEVCERLRERVEAHHIVLRDGETLGVTVSIGVAAAPPHDLDVLVGRADDALSTPSAGGASGDPIP